MGSSSVKWLMNFVAALVLCEDCHLATVFHVKVLFVNPR